VNNTFNNVATHILDGGVGTIYNIPTPSGPILDPNLVGSWNFDQISGDFAVDASGYGNNGFINGAVTSSGVIGQALSFDGTNDNVNAGNATSLTISGPLTLEAWVKFTEIKEEAATVSPKASL